MRSLTAPICSARLLSSAAPVRYRRNGARALFSAFPMHWLDRFRHVKLKNLFWLTTGHCDCYSIAGSDESNALPVL